MSNHWNLTFSIVGPFLKCIPEKNEEGKENTPKFADLESKFYIAK